MCTFVCMHTNIRDALPAKSDLKPSTGAGSYVRVQVFTGASASPYKWLTHSILIRCENTSNKRRDLVVESRGAVTKAGDIG